MEVMWVGLPYPSGLVSGREVCVGSFSRVIRVRDAQFVALSVGPCSKSGSVLQRSNLHADMESCVVLLKNVIFGFVHQILIFKGRPGSIGKFTEEINTIHAGRLMTWRSTVLTF